MINIQNIENVADCVPLYLPHSLYLKPLARMNISVSLPSSKMGKSISNLDIMDKLSSALKPDKFLVIKVSKSTLEFIRFEAELDDRSKLRSALARIDGIALKISGFSESFKVRASEPKDEFPTRHDWDSFFRDASNMDEMKAGERPDTIHFTHLPIRWFCPRHMENEDNVKPSESIFRRIFEKFGRVRCVDVPICDPYRNKMNADINGMKTHNLEQDVLFEAYVQFEEYVGFVRAMDEFRGMKLVRKYVDKTQAINIYVNFDKTKHLSDAQIQRRDRVRKRLIGKAKNEEEEKERLKKIEMERLENERKKEEQLKLAELERQRERENRRKEKHLKKIQERGQVEISQKIRIEERKLMIAQRKLESIRILEQLFDRIKLKHLQKHNKNSNLTNNVDLRDRLVEKYKSATEKLLNEQKKKVQEIKSKTPLLGLLKIKKYSGSCNGSESDDHDNNRDQNTNDKRTNDGSQSNPAHMPGQVAGTEGISLNPFKAAVVAAATAGGAAGGQLLPSSYHSEVTSEWMKSLSMFPYVPQVFPGIPMFRPNFPTHMSAYRGYAPRMRSRGRGGRGRGRGGGYDGSAGYSNSYRDYNYEYDNYDVDDDYYHKSSYSRSRNRSRSRSRTRSRTRSRSRSRSRSRNRHYSKRTKSRTRSRSRSRTRSRRTRSRSRSSHSRSWSRSRSRSRTHSKSKIRSKTPQARTNKKLVSTRRSRSSSARSSRSRSLTSRSHRAKRSWSRKAERSSRKISGSHVVIETDKLVRSAEEIKRTIEKDLQVRLRDEENEIKDNFRKRRKNSFTDANSIPVSSNEVHVDRNEGKGSSSHRSGNITVPNEEIVT